jgi:acyl-CoA thioesterase I
MFRRYFSCVLTAALFLLVLSGSVLGADVVRVACVGDSITAGAGIRDRSMHYPSQLGRMLGSGYEVKNFGNSGSTMLKKGNKPYWKQRSWTATLKYNPNIVVIKLGTNDSKPRNWKFKSEFAADYKDMIDQLQKLPAKPKIFICKPVPAFPGAWGITDKVIREEVIPLTLQVAKEKKLPVIDLYKALTGKKELVPDRVHPNAAGATVMARVICEAITGKKAPEPVEPLIKGKLRHTVLLADAQGKVVKISPEGKIVWEFKAPRCHDAWMLPGGNMLVTYAGRGGGGVMEVSPDKKVVWKYEAKGGVYSAQRLDDGNTLVGDCGSGKLLEVTPTGKIVKEVKVKYKRGGGAMMRNARKLASGNYLVAHHVNKVLREYTPEGKVVLEIKTAAPVFSVLRLANGNTLYSQWFALKEVDPTGKVVWSMTKKEIVEQLVPGGKELDKGEALMAGIQLLPSGNIAVANYFGHGKGPHGAVLFEVTRKKKVVWQYTDKKAIHSALGIQIIDAKGPAIR